MRSNELDADEDDVDYVWPETMRVFWGGVGQSATFLGGMFVLAVISDALSGRRRGLNDWLASLGFTVFGVLLWRWSANKKRLRSKKAARPPHRAGKAVRG